MKFSLASLIALALASTTIMALPEPAPAPAEPTTHSDGLNERALEKRTNCGIVLVDGLVSRRCPKTNCAVVRHYSEGDHVDLTCFTRTNTTVVEGDAGWGKLTDGNWVNLCNSKCVAWLAVLQLC